MALTRVTQAVCLAAAAVLLSAAVGQSAPIPATDVTDDFKFLPADSDVLVVIQMDQLLASDGFKKLCKEMPVIGKEILNIFRANFGFGLTDLEGLTIGGKLKGEAIVSVFHLKNVIKREAITKALVDPQLPGAKRKTLTEEKIGAFTLYVTDDNPPGAFCFPNDKTLLFGGVKEMRQALERNKKPDFGTGLQAGLKEADFAGAVVMAFESKAFISVTPLLMPGTKITRINADVSGVTMSLKVGSEVSWRFVGVCKDATAAEAAKKQAEAGLMRATQLMKDAPNKLPQEIVDLPSKVKIATKGNLVEATATVPANTVVSLIKVWFMPVAPPPPAVGTKPPVEKKP